MAGPRTDSGPGCNAIALIDPGNGAEGITRQLQDLITHLRPTSIDLLDVGGDVLARGDEPILRSPLADSLTLAACAQVGASVSLLVAGPGLDGELPHEELRKLLGPVIHTFTAEDTEPIGAVLDWHLSEATGMLTAAARHSTKPRCGESSTPREKTRCRRHRSAKHPQAR
ncbi:DUF1152 domain-containing protein [Streptomyces griseoviridis]|uniref:DUF1152 domain-containing protein n=1 Tax=Streptomyces griseoviridis TaxID=45398 RepID=A0A3Q9KU16_STRGD|nr:DUF1152 domain-containing protein [Streptomyces griseoviridis]QCN88729.1 hypothetical protein DDJ31_30320 [Streptomyces griseoviridis]